jgi:hypothetical protein
LLLLHVYFLLLHVYFLLLLLLLLQAYSWLLLLALVWFLPLASCSSCGNTTPVPTNSSFLLLLLVVGYALCLQFRPRPYRRLLNNRLAVVQCRVRVHQGPALAPHQLSNLGRSIPSLLLLLLLIAAGSISICCCCWG